MYKNRLSESDRIIVKYEKRKIRGKKAQLLRFSVQYEILIEHRWRKVTRIDNFHGETHRHIFYPDGKQRKILMGGVDPAVDFISALESIKITYQKLRRSYEDSI